MKKILIFGMTGNIGGLENYIMYQYRQFDKTKLHLDFISAYKNVKIAYLQEIQANGSRIYNLSDEKKWKMFLSQHKNEYDTIIFNTTNPFDLYMLHDVKQSGAFRNIIIHSHNGGIDFPTPIKTLTKNKFAKKQEEFQETGAILWACSDIAGRWMFGEQANFTVIKNGIDTNHFKFNQTIRDEVRKELNLGPDDFVIGNIARFAIQKNHKFLIYLFKETLRKIPNAKLLLVGQNAPAISMLKQITQVRVHANHMKNNVLFLGLRSDPERLYQAMDVFVLPSLYEGLPVVGVEAQCSGLPCLFSNTITREAKLLDSTKYLPINPVASKIKWANSLEEIRNLSVQRNNAYEIVREKGFDIKSETERVQELLIGY